jgi:hypothetical protein
MVQKRGHLQNPGWIFIAHNGKLKSLKVGDKAAAEVLARKIRERLKPGELQIAPGKKMPTFGEYGQRWLEGYGGPISNIQPGIATFRCSRTTLGILRKSP